MGKLTSMLLAAGAVLLSSPGFAAEAEGYVGNNTSNMTRTGYGECLHTQRWSEANAVAECDPEIVAARDAETEVAAVEVVMVKEMKQITLESDALFDFDSAQLTESGKSKLNEMLTGLSAGDLQNQKIQVTGHADRIGDEEYNLDLSQRRAAAVREHLVSQGVVPDFIETSGVGERQPLVECENLKGQALIECLQPNRRTDVEFSAMEVVEVERAVPAPQQ